MNRVFTNDLLQGQFETDGYVVIPQFLNTEEVQNLLSVYQKPVDNINGKFHRTLQFQSVAYKKDLSLPATPPAYLLRNWLPLRRSVCWKITGIFYRHLW